MKQYIKETHSYHRAFLFFLCVMTCLSLTLRKKTSNLPKKNVSMPRMDEKKLHTRECQLKGSGGNMRCKLLQKRFTGKTTECSKNLCHIAIEKCILSELNRCIFQLSLKYIKLVIPKILFMLVLCSLNKVTPRPRPPPQDKNFWPLPSKGFSEIFNHPPPAPPKEKSLRG